MKSGPENRNKAMIYLHKIARINGVHFYNMVSENGSVIGEQSFNDSHQANHICQNQGWEFIGDKKFIKLRCDNNKEFKLCRA